MRRPIFSFLVALMAAGLVSPAFAQTPTSSNKSSAAKPATGDDALSPSTLPKARQNVKEEGANRIDELSPDEARRLERIRAKAAAAKPQPAKSQDAKPETIKSETVKTGDVKPNNAEPQRAAAPEQPAPKQAAKSPPAAAETKAPVPSQEVVRAPVVDAKPRAPALKAAGKANSYRASRQASRRTYRPFRESADLDARRRRRWDDGPPRRRWPEVADRAPRVGDIVPYDAPLYPPPPGYGRGRGFLPYPGEGAYGYPPPGYGRW